MASRTPLSPEQIADALGGLPGWTYEDDRLKRSYTFSDFREAVGFIVRLAFCAEELNHHPELHNVYNRVDVALGTHDAGGKVTEMDLALARAINGISQ